MHHEIFQSFKESKYSILTPCPDYGALMTPGIFRFYFPGEAIEAQLPIFKNNPQVCISIEKRQTLCFP